MSVKSAAAELALARADLACYALANDENGKVAPSEDDRLLTAEETAELLGQKVQWVYAHANELPRVSLPGRTVRFSQKRLKAWIARRSS